MTQTAPRRPSGSPPWCRRQVQSPQVASILPSAAAAAARRCAPAGAVPVPVPTPVPVAIAPPAPVPAAAPVSTRVVLQAKTGGWVQVRETQGQVLLNRVLRAGESWPVPMKPQLLLTTSNAGAMELLVDGVAAPALGQPGPCGGRAARPDDEGRQKAGLARARRDGARQ